MRERLAHLILILAVSAAGVPAQITATVNIDATQVTPLNANFSGFNYEGAVGYEAYDYRFNTAAAQLAPGWIRYPAGIASDAFDWQNGLMNPSAVTQFQSTAFSSTLTTSIEQFAGKGGHQFLDVGNQAVFLGAKLIVVVNAFTDTPGSAGQMAAYALANHIPVAAWELCNEPYFFVPLFFQSGKDYAGKMKPYRDAIKAQDPNAVVALFFSDPGNPKPSWDNSVASYTPAYWDAITYHHYGAQSSGDFTQWMTDENANLVNNAPSYVTSYLAPMNPPGTQFLLSEFNPTGGDLGNSPSLTDGTIYAAIYTAEYIMRMSTVPSVLHVGMHALSSTYGIDANNRHFNDVQNAYLASTSIDTATLNFGFFPAAQAEGAAILNGVLRNATQVLATGVSGGATVAATGLGQIPALYAQAYANPAGYRSVVLTNKSAIAQQVTINLNGTQVSGPLPLQYVSGADPSTVNASTAQSPIVIQNSSSANPIPVPAYSVVRVDLNGGVTVETSPPGLSFSVDSQPPLTAPQFLNLSLGPHTIAVPASQPGAPGIQYAFTGWSDGGAASHGIAVGVGAATYVAGFKTQYQLNIGATPPTGGGVAPASGSFYDAGSLVTVTAAPVPPYAFGSWSGAAQGSVNPLPVILDTAKSVTASFVNTVLACEISGTGLPGVADVQVLVNQALGNAAALNDLNADGVVNLIDLEIEINAVLNLGCAAQ